jgi:hypothetical protein
VRADRPLRQLGPSTELANSNGKIRHLVSGTEIDSIVDLEALYRRLLREVVELRRAAWTVRSHRRKVRLVKPNGD